MSCSRVSMFLAATAIRRNAPSMSGRAFTAVEPAAVGVAAPGRVDLGQVGVVPPVPRVDQRQQAGAVGAGLGAEDPGGRAAPVAVPGLVGQGVRAQVVATRAARRAPATAPIASSSSAITCGNASRKNPEMRTRDVDPRPAEFGQRDDLEAGDPARRVVPHRAAADAARAPRRCRRPAVRMAEVPHTVRPTQRGYSPSSARCLASSESARARPVSEGRAGRDGLRVDRVEVAPGRQHVDQAARSASPTGRRARSRRRARAAPRRSRRWWRAAAARARRRRTRAPARLAGSGSGDSSAVSGVIAPEIADKATVEVTGALLRMREAISDARVASQLVAAMASTSSRARRS